MSEPRYAVGDRVIVTPLPHTYVPTLLEPMLGRTFVVDHVKPDGDSWAYAVGGIWWSQQALSRCEETYPPIMSVLHARGEI